METAQVQLDHELAVESVTWEGLQASVEAGYRTEFEAEQMFYDFFKRRKCQENLVIPS